MKMEETDDMRIITEENFQQESEETPMLPMEEDKMSMEEEINTQEEFIRKTVEEELDEEEMNEEEMKKRFDKDKIHDMINDSIENISNVRNIKDTQINPGIGIGVAPVNIYINGEKGIDVNGIKREVKPKMKEETKGCSANYYKNASRIYNNSDWINATNSYQHEKYNYDKLSPCSAENNSTNYLLPCIQPEANKIPQTLNNLLYSKKSKDDNEACPIEVNNPWSSYKSGDDINSNKILPEGYNI